MKAVILVAGVGSRLKPLTDNSPKSLLPIGNKTTLGRMVSMLSKHGVTSFVIVTGNMEDKIKGYLTETFPALDFTFITNDKYLTTNTGYSLLVTKSHVIDGPFLKLDGDVNFDEAIIERLMATPDDASYVTVDNTAVDDEVIKVHLGEDGTVTRIGNKISVEEAVGESIGIEKISAAAAPALFAELEVMMADEANHQKYYEVAYDTIVQNGEMFKVVDITGLPWVEMDNHQDYQQALEYFSDK